MERLKAVRVFVENGPEEWHVQRANASEQWGKPSVAVCRDEETAQLMAAGPELLAACKMALEYFNGLHSVKKYYYETVELVCAIKKAEGGRQ